MLYTSVTFITALHNNENPIYFLFLRIAMQYYCTYVVCKTIVARPLLPKLNSAGTHSDTCHRGVVCLVTVPLNVVSSYLGRVLSRSGTAGVETFFHTFNSFFAYIWLVLHQ
jgi:hypothetical protein